MKVAEIQHPRCNSRRVRKAKSLEHIHISSQKVRLLQTKHILTQLVMHIWTMEPSPKVLREKQPL